MASSTEGAFPRPQAFTEAEWRLLLTAVAGPLRDVYGEGPANVEALTGVPIMVADNRGKKQPMLVTVQVVVAGLAVFGRSNNPTLVNGLQHNFALVPTFRQVLMPGDRLFMTILGANTITVVHSVVI
jgi:hypothetical protein